MGKAENRFEKMGCVDIVLMIEGGDGIPMDSTREELQSILSKISPLRYSTGSYGRLCAGLENLIADLEPGMTIEDLNTIEPCAR